MVKLKTHSKCGCVPGKIECDTAHKLRLEVEHWQTVCHDRWHYDSYIWAAKRYRCHKFEAHFSRKELNMLRQYLQLADPRSKLYHPNKAAFIYQENEALIDKAKEMLDKELGGDYVPSGRSNHEG